MMLRRGDIVDVLLGEGESIVLTSDACLLLTAVPTAIVELLVQPRSLDEVVLALEERFGPSPEGRLDDLLAEMARRGVIVAPSDKS